LTTGPPFLPLSCVKTKSVCSVLIAFFFLVHPVLRTRADEAPHNVCVPVRTTGKNPRVLHTQTLLADGRVLLAGGFTDLEGLLPLGNKDLEVFDPKTGDFTMVGQMPTIRAAHTATVLPDGRVLFIGGSPSTVIEAFDPRDGKLSSIGHLHDARAEHAATLLPDGKILITGGIRAHMRYRNEGFQRKIEVVRNAELFDPDSGTSQVLSTDVPIVRRGHTQTLLGNGSVLIVGGDREGSVLLYDTTTGKVRSAGRLAKPREDHQATLLGDGRVLISGGSTYGKSLATAEFYDPARNRFTPLTSTMSAAREDHTATLLADGRVLLTGGEDNQAGPDKTDIALRTIDIFDPWKNEFARLKDLGSERDDHRATLLRNGSVFIFGGQTTKEEVLKTGELFLP